MYSVAEMIGYLRDGGVELYFIFATSYLIVAPFLAHAPFSSCLVSIHIPHVSHYLLLIDLDLRPFFKSSMHTLLHPAPP